MNAMILLRNGFLSFLWCIAMLKSGLDMIIADSNYISAGDGLSRMKLLLLFTLLGCSAVPGESQGN